MVPGHEIAGIVEEVGSEVTKHKVGDRVGVGCIVDTCKTCERCTNDLEPYCSKFSMTYNYKDRISPELNENGVTYGGYSERIVVNERYALSIPDNLSLQEAAPLLCAGITVYAPLVDAQTGPGKRVGIVGIGGLGHVALKIARALGAHVVGITRSIAKKEEILSLGAHEVIVMEDEEALKAASESLDTIVDTVSADHPIEPLLGLLKFEGRYQLVGAPSVPLKVPSFPFLRKRLHLTGTLIGSARQTQEMLDLCGKHNIGATIETLPLSEVNTALERLEKGDVRYRFVLDIKGTFT